MSEHICKTCKHAEWQMTEGKNPRANIHHYGHCAYSIPKQSLPICATRTTWRSGVLIDDRKIFWDDQTECPVWDAKKRGETP